MDLNRNIHDMKYFINRVDIWLDENVSQEYKDQPLAQDLARVAKVGEEAGEAIEAFLGYTGQNPRKGRNKELGDVLDELSDVVITGLLGIQHFTKNTEYTMDIIFRRMEYRISSIPEEQ
jgi:NTP pyrophosphatase (non-canonical NTP hydrolase)